MLGHIGTQSLLRHHIFDDLGRSKARNRTSGRFEPAGPRSGLTATKVVGFGPTEVALFSNKTLREALRVLVWGSKAVFQCGGPRVGSRKQPIRRGGVYRWCCRDKIRCPSQGRYRRGCCCAAFGCRSARGHDIILRVTR